MPRLRSSLVAFLHLHLCPIGLVSGLPSSSLSSAALLPLTIERYEVRDPEVSGASEGRWLLGEPLLLGYLSPHPPKCQIRKSGEKQLTLGPWLQLPFLVLNETIFCL